MGEKNMSQNDSQVCTSCGSEKKYSDFYASSSSFHKHTGKLSVCKECFWEFVNDDLNKLKIALRMVDKPFILDILKSSQEESEKTNKNLIKLYMKNIVMNKNKASTWDDSEFQGHITNQRINIDTDIIEDEYEHSIDNEIIKYWGNGYESWEIEFLEDEKNKLMTSFECPDYGMEMIMKDICFINLDIEKLRQEKLPSNQKTITALIETRSKLMNSANMNPIQSTGADANDQITFGTLIKKWENERPVPKPIDDEMKRYIDTFMIGHLAKMEGLNNEMTLKYDNALSKYTISIDDIHKNKEEFDD